MLKPPLLQQQLESYNDESCPQKPYEISPPVHAMKPTKEMAACKGNESKPESGSIGPWTGGYISGVDHITGSNMISRVAPDAGFPGVSA